MATFSVQIENMDRRLLRIASVAESDQGIVLDEYCHSLYLGYRVVRRAGKWFLDADVVTGSEAHQHPATWSMSGAE